MERYHLSRTIDQVLLEVPCDVPRLRLFLEVFVHGTCITSINVDLLEERIRGAFALRKLLDIFVAARLLPAELVAGEGKDLEALATILSVQLVELSIVELGQPSHGRHIHYKGTFLAIKETS